MLCGLQLKVSLSRWPMKEAAVCITRDDVNNISAPVPRCRAGSPLEGYPCPTRSLPPGGYSEPVREYAVTPDSRTG